MHYQSLRQQLSLSAAVAFVSALGGLTIAAHAVVLPVDKTWTNGGTTANKLKWSAVNNWSPSGVPTPTQTAGFTSTGLARGNILTLGANQEVGAIQFDGTPDFKIGTTTGTNTLQLDGVSDGNGGLIGLNRSETAATDTTATNTQTINNATTLGNNLIFQVADQSGGSAGPGAVVYAGVLSDGANAYGITKTGTGQLQLTGTNTYKGATTVSAGSLIVNGTNGGTGAFTVGDGTNAATLGGSGSIASNVTVANNATLSPGTGAGNLTAGALALADATVLSFDLNQTNQPGPAGGNDLVTVNGNLTLDGVLNVAAGANFGPGTYELFAYSGTLVDHTLAVAALPNGLSGTINTSSAGVVSLVVTPEPALLGLLGVAALMATRRNGRANG